MAMGGGDLRLRRVQSVEETEAALVFAKEYGQWAVRFAKSEYGIDAEAESEHGLSTSIEELLEPRGRLYHGGLDPPPAATTRTPQVQRRDLLGGLLHEYELAA
jgi:hypothetical protein